MILIYRNMCMVIWAVVALILMLSPAHAHPLVENVGAFFAGIVHPLTTPKHLIPLFAMALLFSVQDNEAGCVGAAVFFTALAGGGIASTIWLGYGYGELATAATFGVLGALLLIPRPLPWQVTNIVAVLAGMSEGYQNGVPVTDDTNLIQYFMGVVALAMVVVIPLGLVSARLSKKWTVVRFAIHVIGSWVLAAGLLLGAIGHSGDVM